MSIPTSLDCWHERRSWYLRRSLLRWNSISRRCYDNGTNLLDSVARSATPTLGVDVAQAHQALEALLLAFESFHLAVLSWLHTGWAVWGTEIPTLPLSPFMISRRVNEVVLFNAGPSDRIFRAGLACSWLVRGSAGVPLGNGALRGVFWNSQTLVDDDDDLALLLT